MFYRNELAQPLTADQVDQNFHDLDDRITDLETNPPQADGIANIVVSGRQMTIFLESGDSFGPFTLPSAAFQWRGQWLPSTGYFEFDLVINGFDGLYLVLQNHVSGLTFDPDAENSDEPIFQQVVGPFNTVALSELSDVNVDFDAHGNILRWDTINQYWNAEYLHPPTTVSGTTHTLGTDDLEKYIRFTNPAGCIITVITAEDEDFWTGLTLADFSGQEIHLRQAGGALTIEAGPGVTVEGIEGFLNATNRQGAVATLKYWGENEWDLFGLLEPDGSVGEDT